jgi:hypothetical protein
LRACVLSLLCALCQGCSTRPNGFLWWLVVRSPSLEAHSSCGAAPSLSSVLFARGVRVFSTLAAAPFPMWVVLLASFRGQQVDEFLLCRRRRCRVVHLCMTTEVFGLGRCFAGWASAFRRFCASFSRWAALKLRPSRRCPWPMRCFRLA